MVGAEMTWLRFSSVFRLSKAYNFLNLVGQRCAACVVFRCVRISITGLVSRSVGRLVGRLVRNAFVKIDEKWKNGFEMI